MGLFLFKINVFNIMNIFRLFEKRSVNMVYYKVVWVYFKKIIDRECDNMATNLVFTDEDEEKFETLKGVYHKTFSEKTRAFLRKRLLFKLARGYLIAKEKTFFPDMKRKKFITRLFNNWAWTLKYNSVNTAYNRFGLDIKNFRKASDYLDFEYVKKDRAKIHHKDHPLVKYRAANVNTRYSIIADNKHVFYSYVESMLPNGIPKTSFVFQGNKVISPMSDKQNTKKAFENLPDGKYICKPTIGSHGDMIVAVTKKGKSLTLSDKSISIDALIEASIDTSFLVQEFLKQHDALNKFNSSTVNTLRIISTRWNDDVHILAAMIRIGAKEDKIVDNADAGGAFVAIDIEKGILNEYGYFYNKPRAKKHPITGVEYKDYKIPYWKETMQLIKDLHPVLFGFATIGWDIAITPDGPVIVEINWNYSLKGIQICNGGLKPRWEELKEK